MVWNIFPVVMTMNRIQEIMDRHGWKQKDLAKMTRLDQGDISRYINEKVEISLKNAQKISKATGYATDYIWPIK
jgi:transcriptional regulator with XRE-family HTH domain